MNAQQKGPEVHEHPEASNEGPGQETSAREGTRTATKVNSIPVTVAMAFEEVPVHGRQMFQVLPGMPVTTAISHAACIVDSLREIASEGVHEGDGLSSRAAWLIDTNLAAVFALLTSIESAIEFR